MEPILYLLRLIISGENGTVTDAEMAIHIKTIWDRISNLDDRKPGELPNLMTVRIFNPENATDAGAFLLLRVLRYKNDELNKAHLEHYIIVHSKQP